MQLPWNRYANPTKHGLALETRQFIKVNGRCCSDMAHYHTLPTSMIYCADRSGSILFGILHAYHRCVWPSSFYDLSESAATSRDLADLAAKLLLPGVHSWPWSSENDGLIGCLFCKLCVVSVEIKESSENQGLTGFHLVGLMNTFVVEWKSNNQRATSFIWLNG